MKKLIFVYLILAVLSYLGTGKELTAQVVQNNFNDGNWIYYSDQCWGIGPNNSDFQTIVTNNGFNSSSVCETANLGQISPCNLVSPWIEMNGNDNIAFQHALTEYNGDRALKVYLISYPTMAEELVWEYNYTDGNTHSGSISHTKQGIYKVRWQWIGSEGNSRGQIDNIVIGGSYDADPSINCQPQQKPPVDADIDGVLDNQDAYRYNPDKAYNNNYTAADSASLAFEDLWPDYGDYDLNDLVVDYHFLVVSSAQRNVTDVYGKFTLRAAGATIPSGFGFQLPNVNPASIISVTGYDILPGSGFELLPNGTENGQTYATIIVFDNSKRFLPIGNTDPELPQEPLKHFFLHIKFMNNGTPGPGGPVSLTTLNIHGFNPFIIVGGDRGKEVHLAGYPPTDKMNTAYFGVGDDNSNPATGRYYQSASNLPWAMNIVQEFNYPKEKKSIMHSHLRFSDWAQSGGSQYKDWYQNKPGYRNNDNIY